MTTLLERVRYLGGAGGDAALTEPTQELPPLAEGFERDPEPAPGVRKPQREPKAAASARTSARQPRAGGKFVSPKQATADVADELDMMIKLLAMTLSVTDEPCGDVLNETSGRIAASMAALVSRSPWLMEHVSMGGWLGDVVKFAMAVKPVVQVAWAHHGPAARRARAEQEEEAYDRVPVAEPDPSRYGPWRPNIATA
jgi:hypothetical protein